MSETTHRALRLALASLLLVALIAHLAIGLSRNDLTVVEFFSLFTVLSNAAAVVMLSLLAGRPGRADSATFSLFRGAVTVYMAGTGLVYAVLLATGIDIGLTESWVDWSLHVIGPLALVTDWVAHPPGNRLTTLAPAFWLVFPTVYLTYTLVRGVLVDWYPYPFLDPAQTGGYGGVSVWSGVVLVVIAAFGYGIHWWANRRVVATG